MAPYMSFYSEDFHGSGYDKKSWWQDKKNKNSKRRWIKGKVTRIETLNAADPNQPKLRFHLDYKAPNYSETLEKTMVVRKEAGGWKIISENTRLATGRYSSADQ